jgi:hypothetical protein
VGRYTRAVQHTHAHNGAQLVHRGVARGVLHRLLRGSIETTLQHRRPGPRSAEPLRCAGCGPFARNRRYAPKSTHFLLRVFVSPMLNTTVALQGGAWTT